MFLANTYKIGYIQDGVCLDENGVDQTEGTIRIPGKLPWARCLSACISHRQKNRDDGKEPVTGCEWYYNDQCAYHTKPVSVGDGNTNYKCFNFLNPWG